jgi:unsaturated chondroitin disaccharide hydrolase
MYAFTGRISYLETSMRTVDYYIEHLPDDGLAFWDLDAPYVQNGTPRDSSSATITACGLLLLQAEINKSPLDCNNYNYTDAALRLLTSAVDLALAGEIGFGDFDATSKHGK